MVYCTTWHSWDKPHLVMVCITFDVLLDSVCQYSVEDLCIRGIRYVGLYLLGLFLSGSSIKPIHFGSAPVSSIFLEEFV